MSSTITNVKEKEQKKDELDKLWEGIRSGRKEDLSQLYCISYTWLFGYGIRIFSEKKLIEDAIQDLFLRVWDSRDGIDTAHCVKSYLLVSLRRIIFRKVERRKNQKERNYHYHEFYQPEDDGSIEELIIKYEINTEKKRELSNAVNTLSRRQREAISLKYEKGLTNNEIAYIMNVNKQSVYNHVSEGIHKMRSFVRV